MQKISQPLAICRPMPYNSPINSIGRRIFMDFNPHMQLAGLLEWMNEMMQSCHGKTAVIGISGGKDSSTVAALAVAA